MGVCDGDDGEDARLTVGTEVDSTGAGVTSATGRRGESCSLEGTRSNAWVTGGRVGDESSELTLLLGPGEVAPAAISRCFFSFRLSRPRSRAVNVLAMEVEVPVLGPAGSFSSTEVADWNCSSAKSSSVNARLIRSRWRRRHWRIGSRTTK